MRKPVHMTAAVTVLLILSLWLVVASCGSPSAPKDASAPTASILTVNLGEQSMKGPYSAQAVWTQCPDDDFSYYVLYRSGDAGISQDPGAADTSLVFSSVYGTSWNDTTVLEGETYYYALRTVNESEQDSWSNEESLEIPPAVPPTASVLSGSYTGTGTFGQISLNWTGCPDSDFQEYRLYRSLSTGIQQDPSSASLVDQSGDQSHLQFSDNSVAGLTTYYYALETTDNTGLSAWSNEIQVTTPDLTPRLTVFFIDPSHDQLSGDAILVRTPSYRYYLIDGGDRKSGWSCGYDRILPLLDSLGVDSLDGIVGTHPHSDHIGGLIGVLNSIPVGTVWDSGFPYSTQTYLDYLDAIDGNGADYIIPSMGDMLDWDDDLQVECIHCDPSAGSANNASIVLRVTFQDVSFLFTGDLETDGGEDEILYELSQGLIDDISADVLKVGHHGSSTSTSQQWLEAVDPDYAAIEVGYGNPYGHPHAEVINRLQNYGVQIYRTDLDGTFIITTDGSDIQVIP